jgi:hypothetical protein
MVRQLELRAPLIAIIIIGECPELRTGRKHAGGKSRRVVAYVTIANPLVALGRPAGL